VSRLLDGKRVEVEDLVVSPQIPASTTTAAEQPAAQHVLEEEEHRKVQRSLVTIQRKALSNLEERGLETLFLALGLAHWPAADNGRPYAAPVLLLPAQIQTTGGRIGHGLRLHLVGEPKPNLVLLYILEKDFGVAIDPANLLGACTAEDESGHWAVDIDSAYEFVEERCRETVRGFGVHSRAILGNFQFARMAMVEDLRRHTEELVNHPVIAALAGHSGSRRAFEQGAGESSEPPLDEIPASDDHLVLDADSSQHTAIRRACRGESGVIQGPPGTGKSQTIANLIAELVAAGNRVLFVAEKRAALEAVIKRLRRVDLGHLVLDLHGASVTRQQVMAQTAASLERIHSVPPVDDSELCRTFEARRRRLNDHASSIGRPRRPTGRSVYDMEAELLRAPDAVRSQIRFRGSQLAAMTPERVHEICEWLVTAASLDRLFLGQSDSPWNQAEIRTGEQAQETIDLGRRVAGDLWSEVALQLSEILSATGLLRPRNLEDIAGLVRFLDEIGQLLDRYSNELFHGDAERLAAQLEPAGRGPAVRLWNFLSNGGYRAARRELRRIRTAPAGAVTLLDEVRRAMQILKRWGELGARSRLHRPEAANRLATAWKRFSDSLEPLLAIVQRKELRKEPLDYALVYLQALASDARTPYKLPQVHDLHARLLGAGAGQLLREFREQKVPPPVWADRLRYAWLHSALDQALAEDPALATFDGRAHDRLVDEFRELDRKRLAFAAERVRRRHAESAVAAMNSHPDESALVRREANKRSRHLPVRKLLSQAPNVLTRVAPCWVASPLSVSQLLDARHRHFDVVLFDEASQVPQEDAIPSLLRAARVVVAGDRHQLPPTTFFATQIEESDEDENLAGEVVEGFESLLDTTAAFLPPWPLLWHYRSRDERLIAFSNQHIYDDRLVTFPGALDYKVLSHELVPCALGLSGQTQSSSREVERVVELVLDHAIHRPGETLGVIAMGIAHANRIQAELDRRLELCPDLAPFFSLEREERFFVKNLETVQGDERDAIILSVGYGKAADGTLPHRFGPLTHSTGHRRLNVAITRARRRMTVVSSFHHQEVDLGRSGSRGVELLKAYLEYSMSCGERLPLLARPNQEPLNPFEADIKDALEACGVRLLGQYGASRYRIDLVAVHPERPGRPVLAIECDGAAYHSSASARDRDRLRQEQLTALGWRFHRIWSTDWFNQREAEIERALAAFEQAVRRADIIDAAEAATARTEVEAAVAPEPPPSQSPSPRRPPPPYLPRYSQIQPYTDDEIERLAVWAMSDGLLRTDEDLMRDMCDALGFRRLRQATRHRFEQAIRSARTRRDRPRQ
jgi:very-short-patch-repair endonuclease